MTILKHVNPQLRSWESMESLSSKYPMSDCLKPFATRGEHQADPEYINLHSALGKCGYGANMSHDADCPGWKPMFTNRGICYSYNGKSTSELFEKNTYQDIFERAYDVKETNWTIHNVAGLGDHFTYKFYLNNLAKKNQRIPFRLGILNADNPFDIENNNILLEPGEKMSVLVNARIQVANADLRDLDIETRKCKFLDETQGLTIMKQYTKDGCVFECMIKMAKEECGCIPWNFPHPPGKGRSVGLVDKAVRKGSTRAV